MLFNHQQIYFFDIKYIENPILATEYRQDSKLNEIFSGTVLKQVPVSI